MKIPCNIVHLFLLDISSSSYNYQFLIKACEMKVLADEDPNYNEIIQVTYLFESMIFDWMFRLMIWLLKSTSKSP